MKYIIILLLFSLTAAGQQEFFHAQNKGLLLDEYPNAAAAYSLRRVNSRYTGPLIRVRRDSTGQDAQDIGSIGEALDTVALKAFVRNNSGYVTTWYDQSGNARNATQTTAANQPRIVNVGVIDIKNGKPSIRFLGSGKGFLSYKFAAPNTNWAYYVTIAMDNVASNNVIWGIDGAGYQQNGMYNYTGGYSLNSTGVNADFSTGSFSNNILFLKLSQYLSNNTGYFSDNGVLSSTTSRLVGGVPYTVGNRTNFILGDYPPDNINYGFIGNMSEFIVYPSDQTTTRTQIERNINSYYAIY